MELGSDQEALARYLADGNGCVILKPGLAVQVDGYPSLGIVKVHPVGETAEIYTVIEALR
jgi:hypothetical protein